MEKVKGFNRFASVGVNKSLKVQFSVSEVFTVCKENKGVILIEAHQLYHKFDLDILSNDTMKQPCPVPRIMFKY